LQQLSGPEVTDGIAPQASLIDVNGTLYGTTVADTAFRHYNGGAVFSITPAGKEATIYTFGTSYGGGLEPEASLVAMGALLYGTTKAGGAYGNGTIFAVSKTGGYETVLHSSTMTAPTGSLLWPACSLSEVSSMAPLRQAEKGSGGVLLPSPPQEPRVCCTASATAI